MLPDHRPSGLIRTSGVVVGDAFAGRHDDVADSWRNLVAHVRTEKTAGDGVIATHDE